MKNMLSFAHPRVIPKINSSATGVKYLMKNLKVNWNSKLKVLKIVFGSYNKAKIK